jgi:SNF2 family DNA or RNA helicase
VTENTQPHKDVGASLEPGQPVPPNELQSVEPDNNPTIITNVPLNISADTFASGMNSALQRTVSPATIEHDLKMIVRVMPTWKAPRKPKIETSGFVLPDAFDFIPKEPAKEDKPEKLKSIKPPGIVSGQEEDPTDGAHQVNGEKKKKTRTRLKPPADALSLKDRLFYLLQPPLEGWLGGQEMIMPFEPFPYQYEGIAWLFASQSALLADEMGLGKTMQTITAIRLLLRSGHCRRILLVCPKPLLPNWQRELKTWAEEIPFVVVEGKTSKRMMTWQIPGIPVLLANYELVVRDFAAMEEDERPVFDLMVLDEAQRIKNRDSTTAKTIRSVTRKRSWALTGTPIENRTEELAALFEFMEVVPPRTVPEPRQLSRLADEFILRRTKDLVMTDLPPRFDRDAHIELTEQQDYAYKQAEKQGVMALNEMGDEISIQHVFELVLRLKQICNYDPFTNSSCKLDSLRADMEEISASGGKAILFSQWTKSLDWIAERTQDFNPLIYHGGVPTKKREPILDRFENDPDCPLILMSYGTGAVGLNLQFAGYVFLFDRWWNPAVEDQAINRAHRIGQKTQVIVTKFICQNTIEERIDRVLTEKRELFKSILGDGQVEGGVNLSMSAGDIFGLFDLKAKQKGAKPKPIDPEEKLPAA